MLNKIFTNNERKLQKDHLLQLHKLFFIIFSRLSCSFQINQNLTTTQNRTYYNMIFIQIKSAIYIYIYIVTWSIIWLNRSILIIIATYVQIISYGQVVCILDYLKLINMSCASHMTYQIQHEKFGSIKHYKSYNIWNRKKEKKHDGQERRNC